jgi:hypothetical protein
VKSLENDVDNLDAVDSSVADPRELLVIVVVTLAGFDDVGRAELIAARFFEDVDGKELFGFSADVETNAFELAEDNDEDGEEIVDEAIEELLENVVEDLKLSELDDVEVRIVDVSMGMTSIAGVDDGFVLVVFRNGAL